MLVLMLSWIAKRFCFECGESLEEVDGLQSWRHERSCDWEEKRKLVLLSYSWSVLIWKGDCGWPVSERRTQRRQLQRWGREAEGDRGEVPGWMSWYYADPLIHKMPHLFWFRVKFSNGSQSFAKNQSLVMRIKASSLSKQNMDLKSG